jgi:hypothetical protein
MIPFATETVAGATLSGVECRSSPDAKRRALRWQCLTAVYGSKRATGRLGAEPAENIANLQHSIG